MPRDRSYLRAFRPGPGLVVREQADLRAGFPNDYADYVQPTFEGRAIRPWELFNERIEPWSFWTSIGPGGAGLFSEVQIVLLTANVPQGTLLVVEEVSVEGVGAPCDVRTGATALVGHGGIARVRDTRWRVPTGAVIPADVAVQVANTAAVISGGEYDRIIGSIGPVNLLWITNGARGLIDNLTLWASVANNTLTVSVKGKLVFPE